MTMAWHGHRAARQSATADNDSNPATVFFVVAGICISLAALAVAMRLYIRFMITRNPWWDDGRVCGAPLMLLV
jgi:hypothetical protein